MIVGHEGDQESVARRRALAVRELRAGGAAYLGQAAGRSWEHGRYQGPYLRDTLMDMGAMVETLETSHTWSNLLDLHRAVGDAIRDSLAGQGTPGLVFCHLSHAYPDGASLYFTFIARRPLGRRDRAVAAGQAGGVGGDRRGRRRRSPTTTPSAVDHAPYMEAEVGELGPRRRCAPLKEELDPAGIMNPGKLLPAGLAFSPASTIGPVTGPCEDRGAAVVGRLLRISAPAPAPSRSSSSATSETSICRSRRRAGRAPAARSGSGRR